MGIILLIIILFCFGLSLCVIYNFTENVVAEIIGSVFLGISLISLIIVIFIFILKPLDYKNIKIEYETIKDINTTSEDVRDATFTNKIIEINKEIKRNREWLDNFWIGIFYNKEISELELLEK